MKALQVVRHGRPGEALELREVERPEPPPGHVRVRVAAASLNSSDVHGCYGRARSVNPELPFTLGMDCAGEVDAAGAGAEAWIGKRVVGITQMAIGGLAEYAIMPADGVFDAPPGLDDAEAVALLLPFHTTHLALHRRGKLAAGETLLVTGGAGSLGTAAIQLGVAAGARVIAVAGGAEKVALCRELGADLAIDHSSEDVPERVFEATDDVGADVVCDLVGGEQTPNHWRCVAREGRYLAVGFSGDPQNGQTPHALRQVATGNFSIVGVLLAYISNLPPMIRKAGFNPLGHEAGEAVHADLLRLLDEKKIRPVVGRRVALEGVAEALETQEARQTLGRSVVLIGGA